MAARLRITLAAVAALALAPAARAQQAVELHAFVPSSTRPDIMRRAFDNYQAAHPGVTIKIEQGGATSELQGQYLDTVMLAKDRSLDLFLLDVIRPAQFAAAGWAVPLNKSVGDVKAFLAQYLPAYAEADDVGGKLMALPGFADAMVLFYRKDLLAKYHQKVPATWDELVAVAKTITDGEHDRALTGITFQGKNIEGTVCTFLLPYWSMGKSLVSGGKLTFDREAATKSLALWLNLVKQGVAPANAAQVATDDSRQDFQAGHDVFAVIWPYAYSMFQGKDSKVAGRVGGAPPPAVTGGKSVSCLGGFQWGVSAYSRNRQAAIALARFMSSPPISTLLAEQASLLPVFPSLYKDPGVVAASPFIGAMLPVVEGAKARPVTPRYNQVSEIIRTTTNGVLAGQLTPAQGAAQMQARLKRVLR